MGRKTITTLERLQGSGRTYMCHTNKYIRRWEMMIPGALALDQGMTGGYCRSTGEKFIDDKQCESRDNAVHIDD